ncbi:MAG: glycosyltransferase family 4 protein [Actinobacteria bacterium]|nr:glycosyltransferase family 4 protein [Actinomycetota bacterium]
MRLVIFPNDPLYSIYEKGEVKIRYWNPNNIFSEIHVISLCDSELSPDKIQIMAGSAKLFIHEVGRPNYFSIPFFFNKIKKLVENIKPDIIRAHNPSLMGALAVFSGNKLNIPVLISLHADYNPWHNIKILGLSYFPRVFRDLFSFIFLEPYSYKYATKIFGVYNFGPREVQKYRDDILVIYNRVYDTQFKFIDKSSKKDTLKIISVGRHILGKNSENLIKAIKDLDGFELLLIGDGPLLPYLKKLVSNLKLEHKVSFILKVDNSEIHKLYQKSDIFAIALEYGGVSIPEIEAMAARLPIVISKPLWDNDPELVNKFSITVENSPAGFRDAFKKLLDDKLRSELGKEAYKQFETITGEKMELREADLYKELLLN